MEPSIQYATTPDGVSIVLPTLGRTHESPGLPG